MEGRKWKLLTNISPDIKEDVPVSATQNLGVNEFKNTVTAKKNKKIKVKRNKYPSYKYAGVFMSGGT